MLLLSALLDTHKTFLDHPIGKMSGPVNTSRFDERVES